MELLSGRVIEFWDDIPGDVSIADDSVERQELEMPNEANDYESIRLGWINRLLNPISITPDDTMISNSSSSSSSGSGSNSNSNKHSNTCLLATTNNSSEGGVFVTADQDLQKGDMVLSCESEGFVLGNPDLRRNHCSYCCRKTHESSTLMFCLHCLDCDGNPMVAYCSDCAHLHKRYHIDNPVECRVLQCLRSTMTENNIISSSEIEDEDDEATATAVTNQCLEEIFGSSVALLAIKLVARQCFKTANIVPSADGNTSAKGSNFDSSSWLDKFRLLYEHNLPDKGPYTAIATLLAAAFDAVVDSSKIDQLQESTTASHTALIRSTLGKVLGCSHAIVDPSLPLGRQTLGRAVYASHSFYNHSCAPNAYLSTILPSSSSSSNTSTGLASNSPQTLTARVHLLRPVARGEEITLSYLPLSGLSRTERRDSLQKSYGFFCTCSVCSDNNHPLVLPPNTDIAGIESIRQIQFGLNDKINDMSEKWFENHRYSIIRNEHDRIRKKNSRKRIGISNESSCNESNKNGTDLAASHQKDPAIVLELDRILRTIEMTQKGISNQNLPECHEVSIESDRLLAAACDLWLKAMGESLCVSVESAFEAHFEFWGKTEQIQGLFDPVALGTQCLVSSLSCMLRAKEKEKKQCHKLQQRQQEKGDGSSNDNNNYHTGNTNTNHQEDNCDDDCNDEIQLSQSERRRGLKLLATCLGSDHPWVQKLASEATDSAQGLCTGQEMDIQSAASSDRPYGAKRLCI